MEPVFERLITWLRGRGASIHSVGIEALGVGERGGVATTAISGGDWIAELPRAAILTETAALAAPLARAILDAGLKVHDRDSLFAAHMVSEANESWAPYIESLPTSFAHVPSNFEGAERDNLAGSSVLRRCEKARSAALADFATIAAFMRDNPAFAHLSLTQERFLWAWTAHASRSLRVRHGEESESVLLPLLDLLNHDPRNNLDWGIKAEGEIFGVRANRDIAAGEPLTVSYGQRSTADWFYQYGFVQDPESDEAPLELSVPDEVPAAELKRRLLFRPDDPTNRRTFTLTGHEDTDEFRAVLSFLRISHASQEELHRLVLSGQYVPDEVQPISEASERRTRSVLTELCRQAIAGYPTSLEQDTDRLARGDLSLNARNTLRAISSEKRVWLATLAAGLRAEEALPERSVGES